MNKRREGRLLERRSKNTVTGKRREEGKENLSLITKILLKAISAKNRKQ